MSMSKAPRESWLGVCAQWRRWCSGRRVGSGSSDPLLTPHSPFSLLTSAFPSPRSTDTALIKVTRDLHPVRPGGQISALISVHVQRCMTSTSASSQKLSVLALDGINISWISSKPVSPALTSLLIAHLLSPHGGRSHCGAESRRLSLLPRL